MKSLENTCHIPEHFCGGDSLRRGAISSVCTLSVSTFYDRRGVIYDSAVGVCAGRSGVFRSGQQRRQHAPVSSDVRRRRAEAVRSRSAPGVQAAGSRRRRVVSRRVRAVRRRGSGRPTGRRRRAPLRARLADADLHLRHSLQLRRPGACLHHRRRRYQVRIVSNTGGGFGTKGTIAPRCQTLSFPRATLY